MASIHASRFREIAGVEVTKVGCEEICGRETCAQATVPIKRMRVRSCDMLLHPSVAAKYSVDFCDPVGRSVLPGGLGSSPRG